METKELTLAIVQKNNKILLGLKRRGFGTGKWNGFGGKIEANESIEEACIRELHEESNVEAVRLEKRGDLWFEFKNDPVMLHVHVFNIPAFKGEPTETEEMTPKWFDKTNIPYLNMWPDDIHWLPLFLEGKKFKGYFMFSNTEDILKQKIEILDFQTHI